MASVLITGGTGLIGTALTAALVSKGYDVIILTRKKKRSLQPNISYAQWNIEQQFIQPGAIQQAGYIIHLAGANVGEKRWTARRKQEIIDSRVKSGQLLVNALKESPNSVKAVISASGVDWYKPDPIIPNPDPYTEQDRPGNRFLGDVCRQWENAIEPVTALGKRLVIFRTGVVYSETGGAFDELKKPLRLGMVPILGHGRQVMSWIHIGDLVNLYIAAMENDHWQGVFNAVSPQPVPYKEIMLTLARSGRKFFIPVPVPAFLLKMLLGEMSTMVLKSCTVSAAKAIAMGYTFRYPAIKEAVMYKE